jgi:hypothetical protein
MDNKIQCRKCGGPHLTIKCGKENNSFNNQLEKNNIVSDINLSNWQTPKKTYNNTNKYNKQTYHTVYRAKLSELPNDITSDEIYNLMNDWGHIDKIKLVSTGDTTTAYIDFAYKEQAEYFVSAIDKTPFDYRILSACLVNT